MRLGSMGAAAMAVVLCVACGDDSEGDGETLPPASHAEVLAVLGGGSGTDSGRCAFSSCHDDKAEGELNFKAGEDMRALLVGVTACQAPSLDLVEPGDPSRSWLWLKLTGAFEESGANAGDLIADATWGEPGECQRVTSFGKRMPRVPPYQMEQADLDVIESWILAGAPGPEQ